MRVFVLMLALGVVASTVRAEGTDDPTLKKPHRGFQMETSEFTIAPGADREWCEYRRLPNAKAMDVQEFELRMPAGAHHFVVWRYDGNDGNDADFPTKPVQVPGCVGVGPGDQLLLVNLFGMQTPNGHVRLPKGVAVRLRPHQQVWLNPHMKNFGTTDMDAVVVFNMKPARKGTVRHRAETFAIGNNGAIKIPAGGEQTIVGEWTAPTDLNIIQLSSHQHRFGTLVTAEVEQDDGSFTEVLRSESWEHPAEVWMHESLPWRDQKPAVLRLAQGQRLRWTCRWHNADDHRVHFGVKTTDEMCFVTGYYYRDKGNTGPIAGPGCLPSDEGLTCPFAKTLSVSTP